MIYILYGPNSYHRRQKLLHIQAMAQAKKGRIRLERFFFDDPLSVHAAIESVRSNDLFETTNKIIVVSELKECEEKNALTQLCNFAEAQKDTLLIIYESWTRKALPKELEKIEQLQHAKKMFFPDLTKSQQMKAVREEAARGKISIDADALEMIVGASSDMWGAMCEIERLSLIGERITKKVLLEYGTYALPVSMYEFTKNLLGPSLVYRLSGVERFIAQGDDPYLAMAYLAKVAKSGHMIQKIAQGDIAIKSGRLDPDQVLVRLALG